jgi:uncharacterized membrane protein YkvA (DUF1232 family)
VGCIATIPPLVLKHLAFLKRLFRDLPRQVKLAYCLLFDPRVPVASKVAVVGALGLIVTPFVNLPEWIPVLGEMDVLALTLVATRLFIGSVPREIVEEQERLVKERRSRFDMDVARGERLAVALSRRLRREPRSSEIEFVGVAQGRPSAATQDVHGVGA